MRCLLSGLLMLAGFVAVGCADPAPDLSSSVVPVSEAPATTLVEPPAAVPAPPQVPGDRPSRTRSSESLAAADAMWDTFQDALRARDRDALSRLVADTLNPHLRTDEWALARGTAEHSRVIDDLLDAEVRDALLAIDRLDHAPRFSAARYDRPQDDGRLIVGYGFEEVAPGDWRLVTVETRWSD